MNTHFSDTIWNTETSQSNLETKYRGCTTRIYRATHAGSDLDFNIVMTYNYGNDEKKRNIELLTNGVKVGDLYHNAKNNGCWQTNHIPKSIDAIRVIEDAEELYTESIYEIYSGQSIDIL